MEINLNDEVYRVEDNNKWELAMKDKINYLIYNQTWKLAELPVTEKALHKKWDWL